MEQTMTEDIGKGILTEEELPLPGKEFTTSEYLAYLTNAYGVKLNGKAFEMSDLFSWLRWGYVPQTYGGDKITTKRRSGIRIWMLSEVTREDMRTAKQFPSLAQVAHKKPIQRRTKLYYDLAGCHRKGDKHILPDNWRVLGIKGKQISKRKRK